MSSAAPQQADHPCVTSIGSSVPKGDRRELSRCYLSCFAPTRSFSPLFQESDMRHSHQWHKEARDQREREALHGRCIYRRGKSRPQVERAEEDCVDEICDAEQVPEPETSY